MKGEIQSYSFKFHQRYLNLSFLTENSIDYIMNYLSNS